MLDKEKAFSSMQSIMLPQEEKLEIKAVHKQLSVSIIGEQDPNETRVPITPEGVEQLVEAGHEVLVEENAGIGSRFTAKDYAEAGAQVIQEKAKLMNSDFLLKISPLSDEEISLLKGGQTLISSIYLATRDEAYFRALMKKKVTAIAFELIQDDYQDFPVLRSMCEIAGTVSVGLGSTYLSSYSGGKGIMLGGITGVTPAEVLILGAGTAAEYASRTAIGMGAVVKVFDHDIRKMQKLKHRVGREVFTSVLHPPVLMKAFETADLVISSLQRFHQKSFFLVPEEMVQKMKHGSVIIDMHIDQGSSFETGRLTTPEDPIYREHGVIHYMAPNMTTQVGRTASIALSNVLLPVIMDRGRCGGVNKQIQDNYGIRQGIYLYNGILTNELIGNHFSIPFKDINLLLAAF